MNESILQNFTQALLRGRKEEARGFLKTYLLFSNVNVLVYDELIKRALYYIGKQWEYNKISTVQEHLATSLAESLISELSLENLYVERKKYSVVLACVQNEEHQVGLKMVSNVFDSYGWETYFLGANTLSSEIYSFIRDVKPNVVGISATIYFQMPSVLQLIDEIRSQNNDVDILVGGQALHYVSPAIFAPMQKVYFIKDIADIECFIQKYQDRWEEKH